MKTISTLIFGMLNLVIFSQSPNLVIPRGHTDVVTSSTCSKNGKYLLTGSWDLSAKLWDIKSSEILSYPSQSEIQSVDISYDSKFIIIGTKEKEVKLFKITGELVKTISDHTGSINSVAFSPNNEKHYFATASLDGMVYIYDLSGRKFLTLSHKNPVNSVCFSSDGNSILTCSDNTAFLYNLSGEIVQTFMVNGHSDKINQAKISSDGKSLVTCSNDGTCNIWSSNGIKKYTIVHSDMVTACDISSDNSIIVSGSINGEIIISNISGVTIKNFNIGIEYLTSISILPDGQSFVTTNWDKQIKQWSMDGKLMHIFQENSPVILSACFAKDEGSIMQGDDKGFVKIWDGLSNSHQAFHEHIGNVLYISYSPDGNHFVTGGVDDYIVLWKKNGTVEKKIALNEKLISLNYSVKGNINLIVEHDLGIKALLDINGSKNEILKQSSDQKKYAVFSPDGNSIFATNYSNRIEQFDLNGNKIKTIITPSQVIRITVSADSKFLVAGYINGLTQEWDLNSELNIQNIGNIDGDEVNLTSISSDNSYIAVGKISNSIILYDNKVKTSTKLLGHSSFIFSLNFSKDNKMLLSNSMDGTMKIWDCKSGKEIATLIVLDSMDWVIRTPSGLFDASPSAMFKLKYRVGLELIDLDQFKERYYEPGLFRTILTLGQSALRDVSKFNKLKLYPEIDANIIGEELEINLKKRSGGLGRVSVFINDKEVIEDANPERIEKLKPIKISNFEKYFTNNINLIRIRSFNKEGWLKSPPNEIIYNYQSSKGTKNGSNPSDSMPFFSGLRHLYALVIGTSDYSGDKLDLKYPDKDAKSFGDALKQVGERLFDDRVHISVLSTSEKNKDSISSKRNIEKAFSEIAKKVSSEDVFVVYLSGHGTSFGSAEKSQFYYLTKDIRSEDITDKSIRDAYTISSDDLTKWLKANPTRRQVVILDACHSGDVIKSLESIGVRELNSSQIRAFERMKDRTGIFILTGSAGDKVSYESSIYGQGLLTYSLLQGMSGQALAEGRHVDIAGLFNFSRDRVPELAEGINAIQKPIFVAPHEASSFDIGISDEKVRIVLPQPKPIFIQNTFLNTKIIMDDLELERKMKEYLQSLSWEGSTSSIIYSDVDAYPDAFKMSGLYTVVDDKINITVSVIKNKKKISTVLHEGSVNDLEAFTESLFEKVFNEIQGN